MCLSDFSRISGCVSFVSWSIEKDRIVPRISVIVSVSPEGGLDYNVVELKRVNECQGASYI